MSKQTIVFDFDGVIHKYSKGWQDGTIYDKPNEGIKDLIKKLSQKYKIVIVSTRCRTLEGINAVAKWLSDNCIYVDEIVAEKPPALIYIDDRAIKYDPLSTNLEFQIEHFNTNKQLLDELEKMNEFQLYFKFKAIVEEFSNLQDMFSQKYDLSDINTSKENMIATVRMYQDTNEVIKKYL